MQIDTGDEWFIHVQYKAPTMYDVDNPKVVLVACQDRFSEDEPLLPMRVTSPKNRCKPPVNKVVCSSKSPGSPGVEIFSASGLLVMFFSVVMAMINTFVV